MFSISQFPVSGVRQSAGGGGDPLSQTERPPRQGKELPLPSSHERKRSFYSWNVDIVLIDLHF